VDHGTLATVDQEVSREYQVKAAFLYNFVKYTTWPKGTFARKDAPLVLGIVGEDPFGKLIDKLLADKRAGKHPISIRRFAKAEQVRGVHALFLGTMSAKSRRELLTRLKSEPVLTVADEQGHAGAKGTVAGFYRLRSKIRFEISTAALKRSGLEMSSQVLKLADIVEKRK